jgi:hypothetical protein
MRKFKEAFQEFLKALAKAPPGARLKILSVALKCILPPTKGHDVEQAIQPLVSYLMHLKHKRRNGKAGRKNDYN